MDTLQSLYFIFFGGFPVHFIFISFITGTRTHVIGSSVGLNFSDIYDIIIPYSPARALSTESRAPGRYFKKYPFGVKYLDFADFCAAAGLIKEKQHLTDHPHPSDEGGGEAGLERIKTVKT